MFLDQLQCNFAHRLCFPLCRLVEHGHSCTWCVPMFLNTGLAHRVFSSRWDELDCLATYLSSQYELLSFFLQIQVLVGSRKYEFLLYQQEISKGRPP